MLVAIDASRAARDQKTGVEWYAYHIVEGLKNALPDTVQVVLYTDAPLTGALAQLPPNWRSQVLYWPPRRLWTQVRLAWAVWRDRPDVLFVPAHVLPDCLPAATRTVTMIHDVAAARFPGAYNWFERWYSLATARRALQRGSVIAPSEFTAQELTRLFPQTPIGRITVVPHGLNPQYRVSPTAAEITEAQRVNNIHSPYLIAVGRLETKKNTDALVHAFAEFKKTEAGKSYQLVLVGKPGYGYGTVMEAVRTNEFRVDIICLGWLGEAVTAALVAGAKALAFPSSYEGFGLPALEAAALNVPVVALPGHAVAEIGGEYFSYAHSASPADIATALMSAVNIPLVQLQAARAKALSYTWAESAKQTARVLVS